MALITSYQPQAVSFTHGQGVYLWDSNDKKYLDGLSGIAVCGLGHAHPAITSAISTQAAKLLHTSNVYTIERQVALAEKLTKLTGMEQIFMANSGAEANETAIKVARLFGHQKGIDTPTLIVMEKAFHGRTMATLSASANKLGQQGFEPLVSGFVRVPFNDVAAIKSLLSSRKDIVGVMVEPVQGEGGINPPDKDYLNQLRTLCDAHDCLLILDEIQTGVGRTGKLYSYMHNGILPDILTTAKGLGNGMPIGACLMRGKACDLLQPGKHGSTFGGNPLACHTALTVLTTIEELALCEQVSASSAYLFHKLNDAFADNPHVLEIRGQGLMLGVVMDKPCKPMVKLGIEEGLLFNVTAECVIRLLPPLIINQAEMDELVTKLSRVVERFYSAD